MFQSKGGFALLGLLLLVALAALGGAAVYLGQVAPPAQTGVHHVIKQAQSTMSPSSSISALPELPPVTSPD